MAGAAAGMRAIAAKYQGFPSERPAADLTHRSGKALCSPPRQRGSSRVESLPASKKRLTSYRELEMAERGGASMLGNAAKPAKAKEFIR